MPGGSACGLAGWQAAMRAARAGADRAAPARGGAGRSDKMPPFIAAWPCPTPSTAVRDLRGLGMLCMFGVRGRGPREIQRARAELSGNVSATAGLQEGLASGTRAQGRRRGIAYLTG